jgi:hypothetical protein
MLFLQADDNRKDLYDGDSAWFYAYHYTLLVYGFGLVAALVLPLNAQVVNTYTRGTVFGILFSNRYTQPWWFALGKLSVPSERRRLTFFALAKHGWAYACSTLLLL